MSITLRAGDLATITQRPTLLRSHSTDISVLGEIVLARSLEPIGSLAPAPGLIIDLGANIGIASRWLLERYRGARLVAVEPAAGNIAILRRNLAGYDAEIVDACVGAYERRVRLEGNREDGYTMVDDEGGDNRVIQMQSLIPRGARVGLLKVDIEGAERELFADCREWIGRIDHMTVECHFPYTARDLLDALARNGAVPRRTRVGPTTRWGYQMIAVRLA